MQRLISTKERVIEGAFYFDELSKHLQEWKSPAYVHLHLDDTRIIQRIEYDGPTDRYVGFVLPMHDNLPVCDSFVLTTFEEIEQVYKTCDRAKYAHVVVANALTPETPSFILYVLGTDGKYDHEAISHRWKYMREQLYQRGIGVVSYGADGAGPFLKAMVEGSRLFSRSVSVNVPSTWSFFLMPEIPKGNLYLQDTVHLLAKLRTRILKHSNLIIVGTTNAGVSHIQYVYDHIPKDQHGLSQRAIDNKDKQNYKSIAALVGDDLEHCLLQVNSKISALGTIIYLRCMRAIRDANFDKTLSPLKRASLLWEVTFFFRIWKYWLAKNGYSVRDNFVTGNAYLCVELNSHSLIAIIFNVIHGDMPKEALRIWMGGSQGCEQVFRLLRSMTPTFSTIINFSLKGISERIHKLNYLASIEACDDIIFPRVKRRLLQKNEESDETLSIPTMNELESAISRAKVAAILTSKTCGMKMTEQCYDDALQASDITTIIDDAVMFDHEDEEISLSTSSDHDNQNLVTTNTVSSIKEDLSILRLRKTDTPGVPTYMLSGGQGSSTNRSYSLSRESKCPFVQYKGAYIRKTTALFILQEGTQVSNDRLLRVREEQPSHLFSGIDERGSLSSSVRVGDLCVFRRVDCDKLLLGRVMQFSYLTGNKRQCEYSSTYVDMSIPSYLNIGVYCNYFARSNDVHSSERIRFTPLHLVFTAGYLPMEHFICKLNEEYVFTSNHDDIPFEIPLTYLSTLLESVDSISFESEFST